MLNQSNLFAFFFPNHYWYRFQLPKVSCLKVASKGPKPWEASNDQTPLNFAVFCFDLSASQITSEHIGLHLLG